MFCLLPIAFCQLVIAYDLNHVPCMWFSIIFAAALKLLHKTNKE